MTEKSYKQLLRVGTKFSNLKSYGLFNL